MLCTHSAGFQSMTNSVCIVYELVAYGVCIEWALCIHCIGIDELSIDLVCKVSLG